MASHHILATSQYLNIDLCTKWFNDLKSKDLVYHRLLKRYILYTKKLSIKKSLSRSVWLTYLHNLHPYVTQSCLQKALTCEICYHILVESFNTVIVLIILFVSLIKIISRLDDSKMTILYKDKVLTIN